MREEKMGNIQQFAKKHTFIYCILAEIFVLGGMMLCSVAWQTLFKNVPLGEYPLLALQEACGALLAYAVLRQCGRGDVLAEKGIGFSKGLAVGGYFLVVGVIAAASQFASYEGEGGLKGAMDVLNVERIFVPVEDNGVAIYSGQGEPFREIFKEKEKERRIRPRVKLQLEKNENFFGPGIVFLLRQIDTLGSVRDACAKTGMSYSKGWSLIRSAEKELGYTVVERSPGGKHGGVASVSEAGKDILRKYELLEKDVAKYAEKRYKDIFES